MRIAEIFQSIDGEVNGFYQGRLSTFVRLTGCNLDCSYCDTKYTNETAGYEMNPIAVFRKIEELKCPKVTITGGEPLLQQSVYSLIDLLIGRNYLISVETNGSMIISEPYMKHPDISWVVDYKLNYTDLLWLENYFHLGRKDWVKFVVQTNEEMEIAVKIKNEFQKKGCQANFALSPVFNREELMKGGIQHIINYLQSVEAWDFIVNLQLHKFVNLK